MDKQSYKEMVSKQLDEIFELKDTILKLTMENSEMKDRLIELGDDVKATPNDMELGGKIRHKNWDWIYESPDGGKTIYSRRAGDDERKLVTNPNQMELFED